MSVLADTTRITKLDLELVINAFLDAVQNEVAKGNDITLSGFGTFTRSVRKARNGYNPHTGEAIQLPELILPKFRPGKDFRKAVERKSSK